MDINFLRGVATIIVMSSFLGICWWAYFYRSKESFQQAAELPFADESNEEQKPEASPVTVKPGGEHQ